MGSSAAEQASAFQREGVGSQCQRGNACTLDIERVHRPCTSERHSGGHCIACLHIQSRGVSGLERIEGVVTRKERSDTECKTAVHGGIVLHKLSAAGGPGTKESCGALSRQENATAVASCAKVGAGKLYGGGVGADRQSGVADAAEFEHAQRACIVAGCIYIQGAAGDIQVGDDLVARCRASVGLEGNRSAIGDCLHSGGDALPGGHRRAVIKAKCAC